MIDDILKTSQIVLTKKRKRKEYYLGIQPQTRPQLEEFEQTMVIRLQSADDKRRPQIGS